VPLACTVSLTAGAAPVDPLQADAVAMIAHRIAKIIAAGLFGRVPLRWTRMLVLPTVGAYNPARELAPLSVPAQCPEAHPPRPCPSPRAGRVRAPGAAVIPVAGAQPAMTKHQISSYERVMARHRAGERDQRNRPGWRTR
jgi:hypothetical protein